MNYEDNVRATVSAAEVLTVAVVAARFFQNHHERALCILQRLGDIPRLSVSHFNRRLHALQEVLWQLTQVLSAMFAAGTVYVIDALPLPICKGVRAPRCKKVRGKAFWGYCAAKPEWFFGWQLLSYIHGAVRLIPTHRRNMRGNSREDARLIRQHRSMTETVSGQLEKMGVQRLHARTNPGFMLKLLASLTALTFAHVL